MKKGDDLEIAYTRALTTYVRDGGEASIAAAAELGRRALSLQLGILDMVILHHGSLAILMVDEPSESVRRSLMESASTFFCETLAAFEMTHRGFIELSQTIAQIVQFAAVVCHELRTPLTSIVTSIGMLQELLNPVPDSVEGQLIANISRSAGILKSRTDDLLDLVGFQSGNLSIRLTNVEIGALVREVSSSVAPLVEQAGVKLGIEIAERLPLLVADPNRIEQILTNLVQNALKYGSDGGKIDVRTYQDKDHIVMEVQDYGSGVSLWEQMRIFQPNVRGSHASHEVPGLGIGLALCKELVAQHHGVITLTSEIGKGSLFKVSLPVQRQETSGARRYEGNNNRGRGRGRRKH
jgi:signal transduction histidine kinase